MTAASTMAPGPQPSAARPVRVLYVQFSDPGLYPPVINSSAILAEAGCEVEVWGARAENSAAFPYPLSDRVRVETRVSPSGGAELKRFYARFSADVARAALRMQADWLYVSDPLGAPSGWLASRLSRARVLYHEHDSPGPPQGAFARVVARARTALARSADIAVLPERARADRLRLETGRAGPVDVVWNCPRVSELPELAPRSGPAPMRVLYSGSLSPERLPLHAIDAIAAAASDTTLVVNGYETLGAPGYLTALRERARSLGAENRFEMRVTHTRLELLALVATCDVGLCILPQRSADINMSTMVGASNKAFDYLAGGLALLTPDDARWREVFVDAGYGRVMDSRGVAGIADALRWSAGNRETIRAMGLSGRDRIEREWNYDAQFAPVRAAIMGDGR